MNTLPKLKKAVAVIRSGELLLSRFDPRFGGRIHCYRRDPSSPSGKMLIDSFDETTWNEAEKLTGGATGATSPLSPTEMR